MTPSNMTDEQFRLACEVLGLTQGRTAKLLGVEDRTVRRWASGQWPIPIGTAIILRILIRWKIDPALAYRLATGAKLED